MTMMDLGPFAFHALLPWLMFVGLSGCGHYFFWVRHNSFTIKNQIQKVPYKTADLKRDFYLSTWNLWAVGVCMAIAIVTRNAGITRLYSDPLQYGWSGLLGSILVLLVVHEINFYIFHRWLHQPKLYRLIHSVHHRSKTPSAFSAFSVHPLEMLMVLWYLVPLAFLMPMHWMVLEVFILFLGLHSLSSHANIEFFPAAASAHPVLKYLTNSKHHNDHHHYIKCNFCYSVVIADRWFHTERKLQAVPPMDKDQGAETGAQESIRKRSVV
jgi:sterol desaturase/sphingolipid hydroxylase (fatty acid hydroxylase superfamily)